MHGALQENGRETSVWSLAYVVQADTEQEARCFYQYFVHEKGDWVAAQKRRRDARFNSQNNCTANASDEGALCCWLERLSIDRLEGADRRRVQGPGSIGLDGVLLSRPRYEERRREFKDRSLSAAGAGRTAMKIHTPG